MDQALYRSKDAAKYLGISKSYFYQLVKAGDIPKGTQIAKKCVLWHVSTLNDWAKKVTSEEKIS